MTRFRTLLTNLTVLGLLSAPACAQEGDSPVTTDQAQIQTSEIPDEFPDAYANWLSALPRSAHFDEWITKLNGVTTTMHTILVKPSVYMLYGYACEPHHCGDNNLGIFITGDQNIFALLNLIGKDGHSTILQIGMNDDNEIALCLQRVMEDQITDCTQ